MAKAPPYIYEKLTWPEINEAIQAGKVPVMPVGSIEQHGPHLPLDVDCVCPRGIALRAAERVPERMLVMPTQVLGYVGHVMDFPGTINIHYQNLINVMVDVGKSLAYHGFKKIIFLNGHGSNMPNLDLAARRVNLETDAECVLCAWWSLLTVDEGFLSQWRESYFPGGCGHAGELETSVYMYLSGDDVRADRITDGRISYNEEGSDFHYMDLFGAGSAPLITWTSSYTDKGVVGAAHLASSEKGKAAVEEAAKQLARLVTEFGQRPKGRRVRHQTAPTTMPMPWNQDTAFPAEASS